MAALLVNSTVFNGPNLHHFANTMCGKRNKRYENPETETLAAGEKLVSALVSEDPVRINACLSQHNLAAFRFEKNDMLLGEKDLAQCICIVPKRPLDFPVVVWFRFGVPGDLVLTSPHHGGDGTEKEVAYLFSNTATKFCLLNALHPKSNKEHPVCQIRSAISDPAHNTNTLFNNMLGNVAKAYPTAAFFELHGMRDPEGHRQIFICNSYNNQFSRRGRDLCTVFTKALASTFPLERCNDMVIGTKAMNGGAYGLPYIAPDFEVGKAVFRNYEHNPNTNCTARRLNGGSNCSLGRNSNRFVHLEASFKIRDNDSNCMQVAKAINTAMKEWVTLPFTGLYSKPTTKEEEEEDAEVVQIIEEEVEEDDETEPAEEEVAETETGGAKTEAPVEEEVAETETGGAKTEAPVEEEVAETETGGVKTEAPVEEGLPEEKPQDETEVVVVLPVEPETKVETAPSTEKEEEVPPCLQKIEVRLPVCSVCSVQNTQSFELQFTLRVTVNSV